MEKEHRDAIRKNFSSLVEQTDLDLMVATLFEKGVFSDAMVEPYKDTTKDTRTRKRQLYIDITRRGPTAFGHLLDALMENGYWNLVRDLDPNSVLHVRGTRPGPSQSGQGSSSFLSIFDKKRDITGKEQEDPNSNKSSVPSVTENAIGDTRPQNEQNGNAEAAGVAAGAAGDATQSEPASYIPQFDVVKSTKFFENDGSDIKLYKTRARNRGVLLLFSYVQFKHDIEPYRAGALVDTDNLRYLFTELGFKVLSYLNLSLQETKKTLEELKNGICGERPETVFVVFSSHGHPRSGTGDTDIRCSDGHLVSYFEIINYFNNETFPALQGIPKVFIFQICRGSNKDRPRKPRHLRKPSSRPARAPHPAPISPSLSPGAQPAGASGIATVRTEQDGTVFDSAESSDSEYEYTEDGDNRVYSDILIAHSTVPGYASNRDVVSGSWYIQALCSVFAARAHECHVADLFTLVDKTLRKRFGRQTSSIERWGFNRNLYLHPGLYED